MGDETEANSFPYLLKYIGVNTARLTTKFLELQGADFQCSQNKLHILWLNGSAPKN